MGEAVEGDCNSNYDVGMWNSREDGGGGVFGSWFDFGMPAAFGLLRPLEGLKSGL